MKKIASLTLLLILFALPAFSMLEINDPFTGEKAIELQPQQKPLALPKIDSENSKTVTYTKVQTKAAANINKTVTENKTDTKIFDILAILLILLAIGFIIFKIIKSKYETKHKK